MYINDVCKKYKIPQAVTKILKENGYTKLFPPQKTAINSGVLGKKNFVLSMPTASGKTLIAELCMLKAIITEKGKCLYVVPLRALASEKAEDFKKKYSQLGIKIGIATGDYDIPSFHLAKYQILVATAEKVDSLLRFRASWLSEKITIAIFDEIHYIDDISRGPTLEILITRMRQVNPHLKILALSATIKNANQIAKWLKADCILSQWRPVPLKEGVYHNCQIYFNDGETKKIIIPSVSKELGWIVCKTIRENGQVLVFVNTRRSTQSTAREIGKVLQIHLNQELKDKLKVLSNSIKKSIGEETDIDSKLTEVIKSGVAFHHAGLRYSQRKIIEDAFKQNLIKVICATPTLAAGVNLPARQVIIRDYRRYETGLGSHHIAVFEYKQMCGRAGRPKYDKYGEAILIAKSKDELDILFEEFINAEPEPIISKLGFEGALRMHLLAAISSNYVKDKRGMFAFLSKTFFALQQDTEDLEFIIERIIDFLTEEEMIEYKKGVFKATIFGHLISRLYIDPLTGVILRNGLISARYNKNMSIFGLLHLICSTPDMDTLNVGKLDYTDVENFSAIHAQELLIPVESRYRGTSYMEHLNTIKTAWLLDRWCEEESEEKICKKFNVGPGDIRRYVETSDWLVYSSQQLARIFKLIDLLHCLDKLRQRLKYGVKEELLQLVKLKGVGRVRSRALYVAGFKNLANIRKASLRTLSKVPHIGYKIAKNIKLQISNK
jgi:helicase